MTPTQSQTVPSDIARRMVIVWLCLCVFIVGLMVVIGGLTRLTESGLSIVEWKPVSGILPPMNDTEWAQEFGRYQTSPQFKKSFPDMNIVGFKHIYWLEYIHRLIGRIAGIIFLLPLLCFTLTRTLKVEQAFKLTGIFCMGFIQGIIGWFMVRSGLANEPHVSPYLLAFHLATGFTIFGLLLWEALNASFPHMLSGGFELPPPPLALRLFTCLIVAMIFIQIVLGAGVAGLHAGLTYNTFPLMDGVWVPDGLWPEKPWYKNLFEDVTTIQFSHRIMAYGLSVIIPIFWIIGRNNPHIAHLLPILFSIFVIQFLLGVLTLLFVVPLPLASLHQANALLLFAISVTILHRLFVPQKYVSYELNSKTAIA